VATTVEQAEAVAGEVGYPVVLKVESPDIVHKTESGGVVVGIEDPGALRAAYHQILNRAAAACPGAQVRGVVVEEMVDEPGVEAVIGIKNHPGLGPLVTFGLGGVWIELYRDVAFAMGPLDSKEARRLVRSIHGHQLLTGYRGSPPVDIDAAVHLLVTSSRLAHDLEGVLSELEFNPVKLLARGCGVRVLDVLTVSESTARRRGTRPAPARSGGRMGEGIR
jgi:acyl-CoA synthetase (NDP forming)